MKPRWAVQYVARDGRVICEDRFFLRCTAKSCAAWQAKTAVGGHPFTTPLPEGMAPLWRTQLIDLRERSG